MLKTHYNKNTKIWKGLSVLPLYNPNISVGQAILHALTRSPDHIAQISDNSGVILTNSEIKMQTIRIARNILKMGYENGNVIGIVARNHHHLASVIFACLTIGTPVNIMPVSSDVADLIHMFGITRPKLIVCECIAVNKIREALMSLGLFAPIFTFEKKYDNAAYFVEELFTKSVDDDIFCPPSIGDGTKSIAAILCTSGTTGKPKGASLTHAALLDNVNFMNLTSKDIFMGLSSMHWISGFGCLLSATLNCATRIITVESFEPGLFCRTVELYKVTSTILPPCYLAMLLQYCMICNSDLSSIREFWSGGYAVAHVICDKMKNYLPNARILPSYGMTEMCGIISVNLSHQKIGSVGQICKNIEIKLIDDNGEQCGPRQSGEIFCRSKYSFEGYYGDEESTHNTIDENGWIRSGDVGYFDDGFLYIVDRKKDLVKYRGMHISPTEIEDVILKLPGVSNVCVVGIPDLFADELLAALVITLTDFDITENNVKVLIKDSLHDNKQLRGGVYFVHSLPMTSTGKIKRKEAVKIAADFYKRSIEYKLYDF